MQIDRRYAFPQHGIRVVIIQAPQGMKDSALEVVRVTRARKEISFTRGDTTRESAPGRILTVSRALTRLTLRKTREYIQSILLIKVFVVANKVEKKDSSTRGLFSPERRPTTDKMSFIIYFQPDRANTQQ